MLNILLMILKIIGIVIAVVLGILLLLIVEVLFVPVRFRILASKEETIAAKVNFSWLFRFAYVTIRYIDNKLLLVIRILGIPIYDSRKPKKEKKKKKSKKPRNRKKVKKKSVQKKSNEKTSVKKTEKDELVEDSSVDTGSDDITDTTMEETKNPNTDEKRSMKNRLKQIITVIRTIPKKIKAFFIKIKKKIVDIFAVIKKILRYPGKIKDLLTLEENKSAIGLIMQTIKRLLKHMNPKRVKGYVIFGFDDPCTTGQTLGAISVLYAYLGLKKFEITPDFTQARFEGKIYARGRIRTSTVLILILHLIRDKNFKTFKERIKAFKEE